MKRTLFTLLVVAVLSWAIDRFQFERLFADDQSLPVKAYVLIDAATGNVLAEMNADQPLPPASMSKLMTEWIVLEHIVNGTLQWDEVVKTSRYAADVPGVGIGFSEGESFTVRELFEAMVVSSSNDAAVALAEHIADSEPRFVEMMNERSRGIGLSDKTYFANATGLPSKDLTPYIHTSEETVMTAKDVAKLAKQLIDRFPEVLDISKQSRVRIQRSDTAVDLAATNWMLPGELYAYEGTDGLKTGFTDAAGYCFVGTAERSGQRFIAVVMGAPSKEKRFTAVAELLDYGFSYFSRLEADQ